MALLSRLFQNRKLSRNSSCKWSSIDHSSQSLNLPYNGDRIRLLVFRDHGNDQRILMFDSKPENGQEKQATKKRGRMFGITPSKPPPNPDPGGSGSSTPKHPMRQSSEHKLFGEMMFGSVPMSHKTSGSASLKVHTTRSPHQLLLTQVFMVNKSNPRDSNESESFDSYSITSSLGDNTTPKSITNSNNYQPASIAQSVPMDVPHSPSKFLDTEDSGISGSIASSGCSSLPPTPIPSSPSSSSINSNSFNSLKRRYERIRSTSLENLPKVRADDVGDQTPSRKRPPKFGICLIFGLPEEESDASNHFQTFFFSHIMLLESHMHKLSVGVEKAVSNRNKNFITESLEAFRNAFIDLYTAPRLSQPVWLDMMCFSTQRVALCQHFLKEFMVLVEKYDTQSTKFFISTLITAVLTHHLAWVPTVTPTGVMPSRAYLDKHSAKWLDTLAKTHPYNPLWAQLGDLYGAVGFPLRLSRTVIIGKKADLVCKLLYVLSYFMRCSEVLENEENVDEASNEIVLDSMISNRPGMEPIQESLLSRNNSSANMESQVAVSPVSLVASVPLTSLSSQTETSQQCDVLEGEHDPSVIKSKVMKFFRALDQSTAQRICDEAVAMNNSLVEAKSSDVSKPRRVINRLLGRHSESLTPPDLSAAEESLSRVTMRCKDDGGFCSVQLEQNVQHCDMRTAELMNALNEIEQEDVNMDRCKSTIENMRVIAEGITWSRTNSMFDEYFTDYSEDAQQTRSSLYKRFASIEGSSSIFDEYLANPVVDFEKAEILGTEELDDMDMATHDNGPLTIADEHFNNDDSGSVHLPDSASRDLVTSTLTLMQDVMEDESLENSTSTLEGRSSASILGRHPSFGSRDMPFHRQPSAQSTGLPARCRSTTPTELGRRRHFSQTSLSMESEGETFFHLSEIPLPCSEVYDESIHPITFERNLGRSLMAAYTDHYMSDFVLHGTSDGQFMDKVHTDLTMAVKNPVLDEPIAEAVCIVADTDKWMVKQVSCQYSSADRVSHQELSPSRMVTNIVESVHNLQKLKMSPEFCLMHLEDRLQEIYFKSQMLAEYIKAHKKIDHQELSTTMGVDPSDLPLLLAVAGTHTPKLAIGLMHLD